MLEVAKIGKTVGLKGALKLHDRSDFPKQFKKGAKFHLKNGEILEILHFNSQNSQVIFKNYEDVNTSSALVNQTIYSTIEETKKNCKLRKDEFFYFDIIGLKIVENSEILGTIKSIAEVGGGYLFEIKTDENLQDMPEIFYIPYVDEYVIEVLLDEKKVITKNAKLILENS